jgi:hypothetical protein
LNPPSVKGPAIVFAPKSDAVTGSLYHNTTLKSLNFSLTVDTTKKVIRLNLITFKRGSLEINHLVSITEDKTKTPSVFRGMVSE